MTCVSSVLAEDRDAPARAAAAAARRPYDVALPVVDGSLGLNLGIFNGAVVVRGLNAGRDAAHPSAAQACGLIAAGDRLLAVSGVELATLSFDEVTGEI